jgi:hypothetical protein
LHNNSTIPAKKTGGNYKRETQQQIPSAQQLYNCISDSQVVILLKLMINGNSVLLLSEQGL